MHILYMICMVYIYIYIYIYMYMYIYRPNTIRDANGMGATDPSGFYGPRSLHPVGMNGQVRETCVCMRA